MFGENGDKIRAVPQPEGPVGVERDLKRLRFSLEGDERKQGMFADQTESSVNDAQLRFAEKFPDTNPAALLKMDAWVKLMVYRGMTEEEINDQITIAGVKDYTPSDDEVRFAEDAIKKTIDEFFAYLEFANTREEDGYF